MCLRLLRNLGGGSACCKSQGRKKAPRQWGGGGGRTGHICSARCSVFLPVYGNDDSGRLGGLTPTVVRFPDFFPLAELGGGGGDLQLVAGKIDPPLIGCRPPPAPFLQKKRCSLWAPGLSLPTCSFLGSVLAGGAAFARRRLLA